MRRARQLASGCSWSAVTCRPPAAQPRPFADVWRDARAPDRRGGPGSCLLVASQAAAACEVVACFDTLTLDTPRRKLLAAKIPGPLAWGRMIILLNKVSSFKVSRRHSGAACTGRARWSEVRTVARAAAQAANPEAAAAVFGTGPALAWRPTPCIRRAGAAAHTQGDDGVAPIPSAPHRWV